MMGKMKMVCLFLFATMVFSCGVKCDNAELCVKNNSTDTAYCNFDGGNFYTDTIPPGESACINVGPVEVNLAHEHYVWVGVNTSLGDYDVKVATCHVEHSIE